MGWWGGSRWPVVLEHRDVMLRPLRRADREAWGEVRAANTAWTGPWDATPPPESTESPRSFGRMVADLNQAARAGNMLPWAIAYRYAAAEEPVLAGQMTISGITYGSARWAMAGYWVDGRWAGRGIVPTALALAGDYLFSDLRLHRLEVAIRPENRPSLRVVEKLGFRFEGERPRYLHVAGQWRDHLMFALDADEVGPGGLIGRLAS